MLVELIIFNLIAPILITAFTYMFFDKARRASDANIGSVNCDIDTILALCLRYWGQGVDPGDKLLLEAELKGRISNLNRSIGDLERPVLFKVKIGNGRSAVYFKKQVTGGCFESNDYAPDPIRYQKIIEAAGMLKSKIRTGNLSN